MHQWFSYASILTRISTWTHRHVQREACGGARMEPETRGAVAGFPFLENRKEESGGRSNTFRVTSRNKTLCAAPSWFIYWHRSHWLTGWSQQYTSISTEMMVHSDILAVQLAWKSGRPPKTASCDSSLPKFNTPEFAPRIRILTIRLSCCQIDPQRAAHK